MYEMTAYWKFKIATTIPNTRCLFYCSSNLISSLCVCLREFKKQLNLFCGAWKRSKTFWHVAKLNFAHCLSRGQNKKQIVIARFENGLRRPQYSADNLVIAFIYSDVWCTHIFGDYDLYFRRKARVEERKPFCLGRGGEEGIFLTESAETGAQNCESFLFVNSWVWLEI